MARPGPSRHLWIAPAGGLLLLTAALGAAQPLSRPAYQILRYEEDWRFLADPSARIDAWDGWKYIPLGSPEHFVTLAGEARARYEVLNHPGFGSGPTDDNGYLLERYLFSADLHLGSRFRIFTELQSGLENGRNGGPRLTDRDQLDLHQAFVDMALLPGSRKKLTLRVGRQEVRFGTGRLISPGESLNVRRSLDGARLIYESGKWTWNLTAMRIVGISPGFFDDAPDHTQSFWGVGLIRPHPVWRGAQFTVYYLGTARKSAVFNRGAGSSTRHTAGTRTWFDSTRWDRSYEAIFQSGTFAGLPIRAWALSSETGFTFPDARFKPRLGLHADGTSGDRNARSLGSFDPLFPSSTAYPDPSGMLGPTNLVVVEPTLRLQLNRSLALTLATASFWRESLADGIYGIFLTPLRFAGRSNARYVATHVSAVVPWRLSRHLTATVYAQHFFNGPFLKESSPSRTVNFLNGTLSYRF